MNKKDRFTGVLFGQAIGDALGLGSEFMSKEEVLRYYPNGLSSYSQIIQDDHRCRWQQGMWTDDTDMTLCIADALIASGGEVNLNQIANNFKAWFEGNPLGIGRHTYNVLCFNDYVKDPIRAAEIVWTLYRKRSAANGGIMRTSVVGLMPGNVSIHAENICKLTHPDPRCIGSCVIVSEIIHSLIYEGEELSIDNILQISDKYDDRIRPFIEIANDSTGIESLELTGLEQGYTLKTLSAALWSLWHCMSFEDGLLQVVNAGGDADTNAAIACAVLGAKFGFSSIPQKYVSGLIGESRIKETSEELYRMYCQTLK
ncbi:MAG: ADP-ribosylglycohydrolase family protein [Prevotella sp.]|nr:ADP-ribosylglycohydrolase family protein [Bacteroidales bacterium]MDY5877862.1 ADP-ribosylglycohydrolase family protein [Prevotella sp.]